jgi:CopG family nickel-responsive transcriptional regulator
MTARKAKPMVPGKKKGVVRFSVSLPQDVAAALDRMSREKGYDNRSQAVADMVRAHLVEHMAASDEKEIAGSITLVYDHQRHHHGGTLTEMQHARRRLIVAALHIHLDPENCLEILAVKGPAKAIKHLADELIAAKGVKHGKLTLTGTGRDLPG